MTIRHKIETESLVLFILAAGVGISFAFYNGHKPQFSNKVTLPIMQTIQSPLSSLTPTPTPFIPKPQITSQISPDGTKQLTMTVTTNNDHTKKYTFVTSDADGNNQHPLYTMTYAADSMSIPFNTWSPDDKYVFLTHTISSGSEALVMRADGQPFTDTDPNLNVTTLFTARNTGNMYHETIGWASDTLLIVNTTTSDGTKGPSYWFEVPSKAVIQLSSQF